jgi:hypothetical protein
LKKLNLLNEILGVLTKMRLLNSFGETIHLQEWSG